MERGKQGPFRIRGERGAEVKYEVSKDDFEKALEDENRVAKACRDNTVGHQIAHEGINDLLDGWEESS